MDFSTSVWLSALLSSSWLLLILLFFFFIGFFYLDGSPSCSPGTFRVKVNSLDTCNWLSGDIYFSYEFLFFLNFWCLLEVFYIYKPASRKWLFSSIESITYLFLFFFYIPGLLITEIIMLEGDPPPPMEDSMWLEDCKFYCPLINIRDGLEFFKSFEFVESIIFNRETFALVGLIGSLRVLGNLFYFYWKTYDFILFTLKSSSIFPISIFEESYNLSWCSKLFFSFVENLAIYFV